MFIARRHANILKPQRGDRYSLSESRINTDSAREGDSVLPFAPEERYVYSRATCKYLKAPEGRHVYSTATCKYPKAPEGRHVYSTRDTQIS